MASHRGKIVVCYCKNCRIEQEMKPVKEGFEGKIVWLKCLECSTKIFLKKEEFEELRVDSGKKRINNKEKRYVDYDPVKKFYVGQLVYHKVWDDKGEVLKKEVTNSGGHFITVDFDRLGEKTLVENTNA
ncbi:MAG: hypothetical protein ACE5JB_14925 [bacterium]